jgi:hypothetical protein
MCLCGDYGCSNCDPTFYDEYVAQEAEESAQHSQQHVKGCNHHEQTLGEFASDCGDDESVWGYDGDVW